jgi:hydrogenase maturation protease
MILVGGVAHLYQGDLDLGRHAVGRLLEEDLGPDVVVEDLSYGAVAVTQRLQELRPDALVLVGAKRRGRTPGTVERWDVFALPRAPAEIQLSVADAVTGYIDLDLVLDVAHGLGALPKRTVMIDVEPESTEPSERLSPSAEAALAEALELVRREVAS